MGKLLNVLFTLLPLMMKESKMKNFIRIYGMLLVAFTAIVFVAATGAVLDKRLARHAVSAVIIPKNTTLCSGITIDNGDNGLTCNHSEMSMVVDSKEFVVCDCR
jgi:hypothetical protein